MRVLTSLTILRTRQVQCRDAPTKAYINDYWAYIPDDTLALHLSSDEPLPLLYSIILAFGSAALTPGLGESPQPRPVTTSTLSITCTDKHQCGGRCSLTMKQNLPETGSFAR